MSYPEYLSSEKSINNLLFKKEFAQLNLNFEKDEKSFTKNASFLDTEIVKENRLMLHPHQQFVKNFNNPNTPYTRLLLKHDTGTGKTVAAISAVMNFIKYYLLQYELNEGSAYNFTPAVFIIGFSKQIFQKELLRRPEFGFVTKDELIEYNRLKYLAETGSQADKDAFMEMEIRLKRRLSKKSRGGFFKFFGYKEFFNRLFIFSENVITEEALITEDQIINGLKTGSITLNYDLVDTFANSFMVCDEIHNVYNSIEINNYGIAIRMILNIYDSPRIMNDLFPLEGKTIAGLSRMNILENSNINAIFMSATIINNLPTESIDLLNILIPLSILPGNKKLEKEDFFDGPRNLKPDALKKMQSLLYGYVSYLREVNPKYYPSKIFEGEPIEIPSKLLSQRVEFYKKKCIPYLKFIRCPMSPFHQKTYDRIYEGTLPPDGQSLTDMALPNPGLMEEEKDIGLFRTKDIKYSLSRASQEWKDENQIDLIKQETGASIITGDFAKLENLHRYSTKYATMVEDLIDNLKNDKGKIIISHQFVKMSGVLMIQEILRKNGFIDEYSAPTDETLCSKCGVKREEHIDTSKGEHEYLPARFITVHGDIDRGTLEKSLEKFKSTDNLNGYFYRVCIGSKVINEGIDFNAVQNLWIMNAPTNFPTLIQILGRAVRKNSHIMLPPEKRIVRIRIYVSSNSVKAKSVSKISELSYEEHKYFDKSQDYLVIQQIERIFNASAIDAVLNRDIVMPADTPKTLEELGSLYFEPAPVFGKKLLSIALDRKPIKMQEVDVSTFRVYHSDEEISLMVYIIKRLFIEQSNVWTYDALWKAVTNPPFEVYVNTNIFLPENFAIAIYALTKNIRDFNIDTYQIVSYGKKTLIDRLFDHLDTKIFVKGRECRIVYLNGYYILFPNINIKGDRNTAEFHANLKTPPSYLGINIDNIEGVIDVDLDSWYRHAEIVENTSLRITKYLKASNISYNQMKFKFYNQFKDVKVEEMPTTIEIYDLDFHIHLVEDCIRYAFNILTNEKMPFSELHEFYFKMLYFYDRLELIVFADHLEGTKLLNYYNEYITKADLTFGIHDIKKRKSKILKEDHKYNPFLMTSMTKTVEKREFNINRLNEFLGKYSHREFKGIKKHPKLEDMLIEKQLQTVTSKKINKVFSNILPVGHFLTTSLESNNIVIPKLYIPEKDIPKGDPWLKANELIPYYTPVQETENEIIIGYYEKNPNGLDIKFKLRPPTQKIIRHEDTRLIERGTVCNTKKKEDLQEIVNKLNIKLDKNKTHSIKHICNTIKLELMHREMNERKKVKHMPVEEKKSYTRTRWFYLHFEPQLY